MGYLPLEKMKKPLEIKGFHVLSDSRYAMSGLHHYTGKFKQKMPAGSENELTGTFILAVNH